MAPPALRSQPFILGHDFQVNSFTPLQQAIPSIAVGGGRFVVVWGSNQQDGASYGVFGQVFGASGAPIGVEFHVNSFTDNYQGRPAVGVDGDGDFAVVWHSDSQDGSYRGVFGQRFDAAGTPQAAEFQVSTLTISWQGSPAIAVSANGSFVVLWNAFDGSYNGVFGQRFGPVGERVGGEFQLNEFTPGDQHFPSIGRDGNGGFVVTWESPQDGENLGIFGRRFDSSGSAQGAEFQVNSHTSGRQYQSAVAVEPDGRFVVAWASPHDGDNYGVFAQRFASSGARLGGEFQVNTHTPNYQKQPSVAMTGNGRFVVGWSSFNQGVSYQSTFGQRFNAAGARVGGEFALDSRDFGGQNYPAVASAGGGDFVVAWQSWGWDGDQQGIFGLRFLGGMLIDVDGDGANLPLTDGLLVLRYLFGFRGNVLIGGAVNLVGCSRCTAVQIEGYLDGLAL
jgi:hypothetical protein